LFIYTVLLFMPFCFLMPCGCCCWLRSQEDVINALGLTGQILMGQAVMVKMSEAEKNLAWEAAEQQKAAQKALEVRRRGRCISYG
jgi:hypothetical protein